MGLRIQTNVASLQAQNALNRTSKRLNQSLTRLSTGLRINSGKDDVVGLANSEALRSQIRGADVARSNISSTSAVLGVAEGYLSQLTEVAQGIRDLAVQAADDTISATSRQSLTDNMDALVQEYNRLANSANFNGVKLLDGTFTNKTIQAGTNEGDTIAVSVDDARSSSIGKIAIYTAQTRTTVYSIIASPATSNLDLGDPSSITINGTTSVLIASTDFSSDGVSSVESDESAIAYVNAINRHSGSTGVTASVLANVVTTSYAGAQGLQSNYGLVINGVTVKSDTTAYTNSDADVANLVSLINQYTTNTGVVASQDATGDKLILTASDGRNVNLTVTGLDTTMNGNVYGLTGAATNQMAVFRGTFKVTSSDSFSVTGATAEFTSSATETASLDDTTTLDNISFSSAANAGTAISILDKVIEQLQSRRASVGTVVNRLDISDSEIASRLENLNAAESSIRDADVAAETARFTLYSVLQQVGATILSQANASPQIALTLLQNL